MVTLISRKYGKILSENKHLTVDFQLLQLSHPTFQAELITLNLKDEDLIEFSDVSWPCTLIFVFGYSLTLYLSKTLKKEIHDRGGHLFYSLTGDFTLGLRENRTYILATIHYSTAFLKANLEEIDQEIWTDWKSSSPVFYFNRAKILTREQLDQLSMLLLPASSELKSDFIINELVRSILIDFIEEEEASYQPAHLRSDQLEAFYIQRDALVSKAMKYYSISKLMRVCEIQQVPLFRKRLRQLYNLNTREFVTEIRMTAAMTLLKDPTISIKEIAHMTAFSNALYFSRVFTNYFGQSPRYFRRSGI